MDYKNIYENLIEKRQHQPVITNYYEVHHIIPKCVGGTNDNENLIQLTPEEHYLAHQLLVKIYPNNRKLIHAAIMMIPNRPSNKLYGWLKRKYANSMKLAQSGNKNTQFGTKWICNVSSKQNRKIHKSESIPDGWVAGRNKWPKEKLCKGCNNKFSTTNRGKYCSKECRPTSKGYKHTEDAKKRMSDKKRELYKDPTKNPAYGRVFSHTPASKSKISKSRKNRSVV